MTTGTHNADATSPAEHRDRRIRLGVALVLFLLTLVTFRDLLLHADPGVPTGGRAVLVWLIPVVSVGLVWRRRFRLKQALFRCSRFGVAAFVVSLPLHVWARELSSLTLDSVAFLLAVAGVVLGIWGRAVFVAMAPVVLLCLFMLPLEQILSSTPGQFLQQAVASESAWYLQVLGTPAVARGSVILTPAAALSLERVLPGLQVFIAPLAAAAILAIGSRRSQIEKFLMVFIAGPLTLLLLTAHVVLSGRMSAGTGPMTDRIDVLPPPALLLIGLVALVVFLSFQVFDWLFQESPSSTPHRTAAYRSARAVRLFTGLTPEVPRSRSGVS